jgi:tryptophan-rich sensory protein
VPPDWLETVAWISLGVAFACAAVIVWDIFGR